MNIKDMYKTAYKKSIMTFIFLTSLIIFSGCAGSDAANTDLNVVSAATSYHTAAPAEKSKDIVIAMVPKSIDNPVFLDAKEEAEKKCKELGIKFEWLGTYQSDADEQVMIVESLIRRRVDGIVISCIDPQKMKVVIDEAIESGIKVATFDSDSPYSDRLFYCGTDNYAAGRACGDALVKEIKARGKSSSELNVLVMTADIISLNLNERLKGFSEAADTAGLKLRFTGMLYCNDDINKAGELLEGYMSNRENIEKNPVDIFFSTGGWPLIVPSDSLPNFQKWCKSGGTSIVVDTFYPILVAAKKGMADALVGQNFKKMGEASIMNIYRAIKGERIEKQFIDTGLELGDKDNYDLLIQTKEPWEIK